MAGCTILAKSVLEAIPNYYMQIAPFFSHKKTLNKLENIIRDFVWKRTTNEHKINQNAWDRVTKPKNEGSFGLFNLTYRNQTYLIKRWSEWKVGKTIWANLCRAKYRSSRRAHIDKAPRNELT